MHTSTRMASVCGMVKVSVVIRATPMVAVRPGSAPMTMPRNVAHNTVKSTPGDMKPKSAAPNCPKLSNILEDRQGRRT